MDQKLNLVVKTDAKGAISGINGLESSIKNLKSESLNTSTSMAGGFTKTSKGVQSISAQLSAVRAQLLGLVAAQMSLHSLGSLITSADNVKQLDDRLRQVTSSTQEFTAAKAALLEISAEQAADLNASISLYTGLARATEDAGISQTQLLTITESIAAALRVSGASAAESASAMLQLKQAMASGRLAGEEFNAVSESAPILLDTLAKSLGVARGELKEMAADGEISTAVMIKAFTDANASLVEQSSEISVTVAASFKQMSQAFAQEWGKMNSNAGINSGLSSALQTLAKNADSIVPTMTMFASIVVGRAVPALLSLAAASLTATKGMQSATIAARALSLAGGWVGLLASIASATGAWLLFRDSAVESAENSRAALAAYGGTIDETRAKIEALSAAEKAVEMNNLSGQIEKEQAAITESVNQIAAAIAEAQVIAAQSVAMGWDGGGGDSDIVIPDFDSVYAAAAAALQELNGQLQAGTISQDEYDQGLQALVGSGNELNASTQESIVAMQSSIEATRMADAATQALRGNLEPMAAIIEENSAAAESATTALHALSKEEQAASEELAKYNAKQLESIETLGMSAQALAEYQAAKLGANESEVAAAGALAATKSLLEEYESALRSGNQAQIESAKAAIDASIAKQEAQISEIESQNALIVSSGTYGQALQYLRNNYYDLAGGALDAAAASTTFGNAMAVLTGGEITDTSEMQSQLNLLKAKSEELRETITQTSKTAVSSSGAASAAAKVHTQSITEVIAAIAEQTAQQDALTLATAGGEDALMAYNIQKELETELKKEGAKYTQEEIALLEIEITKKHESLAKSKEWSVIADILDKNKSSQEKYNDAVSELQALIDQIAAGDFDQLLASYGITAEEATAKIQQAIQEIPADFDSASTLMENSIKRLDDGFASMWKDLLSGSKNAFAGFKDIAISTLAEVIHQYTTKKIIATIGTVFSGSGASASASGSASSGLGSLLGLGGGDGLATLGGKIGGLFGAAGASFGASFGAGMSAPLSTIMSGTAGFAGILGAAVPVLGAVAAVASMFISKKPSDKTAGGMFTLQNNDDQSASTVFNTSLQGEKYSAENNAARDSAAAAIIAVKNSMVEAFGASFDDDLVKIEIGNRDGFKFEINGVKQVFDDMDSFMAGAIEGLLENAEGMDERIRQLALDQADSLDTEAMMQYIVSLGQINTALEGATDDIRASVLNVVERLDPSALTEYAAGISFINSFLNTDISKTYAEQLAAANQTLTQQYQQQSSAVSDLINEFDYSADSVSNLANGLNGLGSLALQVAAAITQAQNELNKTITSSIEQIQLSVMEDSEKYNYYKEQAETAFQTALDSSNYEDIESAIQAANDAALNAWNVQDDTGKEQNADQFVNWLQQLQDAANSKLEEAKQSMLDDYNNQQAALDNQLNQQALDNQLNQQVPADVNAQNAEALTAINSALQQTTQASSEAISNMGAAASSAITAAIGQAAGSLSAAAASIPTTFDVKVTVNNATAQTGAR